MDNDQNSLIENDLIDLNQIEITENKDINLDTELNLNINNIEENKNINNKDIKNKDEDGYDTDIEIKEKYTSYDHSGRTMYIHNCYKEGVIPAGYFLRHMTDKKLEMRHHGLGLSGIKPICSSLMTNGSITSLDLTDNWLGDESISYLMAMMKENCFITEFILTNNNLTSNCAELLVSCLSDNLQVTQLNLSLNQFDDQSSNYFGELIIQSPKLEILNLSRNNFGSDCLAAFGRGLSQSTTLIELNLSWNHISGKEAKQFCSGLSENKSLKVLNLGWNGLGPHVALQDLGKMLKTNAFLEELDLSNNRITPEGCVLLGRGLTANNVLKTLKIGLNPMQTAGCYAILNSIIKNPNSSITLLDFENIRVNQDFLDLQVGAQKHLVILTGSKRPPRPSSSIHPVIRLKTFVRKHKLPLVKYFNHFDDAENMQLTINDFRLSLQHFCKNTQFDMTDHEIEMLIDYLDKKQNGYIHYRDFVELNYSEENENVNGMIDNGTLSQILA